MSDEEVEKRETASLSGGLRSLANTAAHVAGLVATIAAALSVIYNFVYFHVLRQDLIWLLSFEDYISTSFQLSGPLAVLAVGLLTGFFLVTVVVSVVILFGLSKAGESVGRWIDYMRIGRQVVMQASRNPKAQLRENTSPPETTPLNTWAQIGAFVALLLPGLVILAYIGSRLISTGLPTYKIPDNADFPYLVLYAAGGIIILIVALVAFRNSLSLIDQAAIIYCLFLPLLTYAYAYRNATSDLSKIGPIFIMVREENKNREAVLMRGLSKVVLVRFVDTKEIAFIEWQEFKMGTFKREP